LLFGLDCRHPTEAATLPSKSLKLIDVVDYQEELVLSLSTARASAAQSISKAQKHQKIEYDKHTKLSKLRLGEWSFPTRKQRKLGMDLIELPHVIIQTLEQSRFFPTDPSTCTSIPESLDVLLHFLMTSIGMGERDQSLIDFLDKYRNSWRK